MNQEQIQQLKKKLNEAFFEREEQIDSMIDAFNNRENFWLYGNTGSAKTALLNALAKGLGYSVHVVSDMTFIHWYLESFITLDKARDLWGIDANIPAIVCIEHPYILQQSSAIIRMFFDLQHERPYLFPFDLIVGESLCEVHDQSTNWLADYFKRQIYVEYIKNEDNVIKFWERTVDRKLGIDNF